MVTGPPGCRSAKVLNVVSSDGPYRSYTRSTPAAYSSSTSSALSGSPPRLIVRTEAGIPPVFTQRGGGGGHRVQQHHLVRGRRGWQGQGVFDDDDAPAARQRREQLEHRHVEADRRGREHPAELILRVDVPSPGEHDDGALVLDGDALGPARAAGGVDEVREIPRLHAAVHVLRGRGVDDRSIPIHHHDGHAWLVREHVRAASPASPGRAPRHPPACFPAARGDTPGPAARTRRRPCARRSATRAGPARGCRQMPTRTSGPTPSPRRWCARRLARAFSSAYVSESCSWMAATASGVRATCASNSSWMDASRG